MVDRLLRNPHRLQIEVDATFQKVDYAALTLVDLTLDEVKINAKARLASWRYSRECAGTALPDGTKVMTDRYTQDALNRILNSLDRGLATEPVTYKGVDGWASLSKAQIAAIAGAVAAHVQACWAQEKSAADQVDAAQTVAAIRTILSQVGA